MTQRPEQLSSGRGGAPDVLEHEDNEFRSIFSRSGSDIDQSVVDRYEYGILGKQLNRQMAIREADWDNVVIGIADHGDLLEIATRMDVDIDERRAAMNTVERMARGIQGVDLNTGHDFDGVVIHLSSIIGQEIEWELAEGILAIAQALSGESRDQIFKSARYLKHHALSHLTPKGRRWHEGVRVISRLATLRDRLHAPGARRGERV